MKLFDLSEDEQDVAIEGLQLLRNKITTGNPLLSPNDVKRMGKKIAKSNGAKIKKLSESQIDKVKLICTTIRNLGLIELESYNQY